MITNITLENFKCFRRISVDPKLITVFIGPNGSGKSGVIQALLLLKQSRNNIGRLTLTGELIRFTHDAFMLHRSESNSEHVRLGLSAYSHVDSQEVQGPVNIEVDLLYSEKANLIADHGSTKWETSVGQYVIPIDRSNNRSGITTSRGILEYSSLPMINGFRVGVTSGKETEFLPLFAQISNVPADLLASTKIVPAARGFARDIYELGSVSSDDISGATGLGTQEDNMATTLAYSRHEVEEVSRLMKLVTGVGIRAEIVPSQSVKPVTVSLVGDLSLLAEGFGTNALVLLLFELVRTTPGATVLIEEPEIHLHPKAQAKLASVLAKEAKTSNKQMVITTHSEHIIGRLLTLVAEGELLAEELAIYSFEKDKAGVCSASEIEVTDSGQVIGGLKDFFEADMDEMQRYVEALRSRV